MYDIFTSRWQKKRRSKADFALPFRGPHKNAQCFCGVKEEQGSGRTAFLPATGKKNVEAKRTLLRRGGEGGIRTLETLLRPTRFPVVRARPSYATSPYLLYYYLQIFVANTLYIRERNNASIFLYLTIFIMWRNRESNL